MLIGNNSDGSKRIKSIKDPNWTKPKKEYNEAYEELRDPSPNGEASSFSSGISWAAIMELEEQYKQEDIEEKLVSLLKAPSIKYTDEQYKSIQDSYDRGNINTSPKDHGELVFLKGWCNVPSSDKYIINVLYCSNIPDWIDVKFLKKIFIPYASDPISLVEISSSKSRRTRRKDTYPIIDIIENNRGIRIGFITFDPNTSDASFALLMTKKLNLSSPEGKIVTLYLDYRENKKHRSRNYH